MLFGVIFGLLVAIGYRYRVFDDSSGGSLWSKPINGLVVMGSILGILSYLIFASYCNNKRDCNEIHSYISFVPVSRYF